MEGVEYSPDSIGTRALGEIVRNPAYFSENSTTFMTIAEPQANYFIKIGQSADFYGKSHKSRRFRINNLSCLCLSTVTVVSCTSKVRKLKPQGLTP